MGMLPCMNCGRSVDNAKLFAECFVCQDCYTIAERLFEQGKLELIQVLNTLKELLRGAILRHQLALPPPEEEGILPQKTAAHLIFEMMLKEHACRTHPSSSTAPSVKTTTKQSVPSASGTPNFGSLPAPVSRSEILSTETPDERR